jgi:hypothetical protein
MTFPRFILAHSAALCALSLMLASSAGASTEDDHDHHAHSHDEAELPAPLGLALADGWFDPWRHADFSRRGTPFVHMFNLEPAFLDRDLFVDYVATKSVDDEKERELAAELEYAITRRIGLIVEAPLVYLDPKEGDTEQGLGDVALAPRALLIETDRFLLSANLEIAFPTGSESKGLGSGEVGLAPSFSTWLDLGNWITFSTQVGTEHGLETGDSELLYAAALTWSFDGPELFKAEAETHAGHAGAHDHFGPGLTSLIVEFIGRTILSGEDDDRSTAEVLMGVSHVLTESLEVRGAIQLPVGGLRDIEYGYIFGLIYHF